MRLLGALLIVAGCAAAGYWNLDERYRKVRATADLQRFIRLCAREMRSTQADLDLVLSRASESCPALLRKGQHVDTDSCRLQMQASLPEEAHGLVSDLFEGLGKSALSAQLEFLERCAEQAAELYESGRSLYLERRKLVTTLSTLAGFLLVILLY